MSNVAYELKRQLLIDKFAFSRLSRFVSIYLPWLDFYPIPAGLILKEINSYKNVIDVGCGTGRVIKRLKFIDKKQMLSKVYFLGLDIWLPSLLKSKRIYDDVILCTAQNLPLRKVSSTCILAIDFIEHLNKNDAIQVLNEFETISDSIILLIPVGLNIKEELEDENPFQRHLSEWYPNEFKKRGYIVRGINGLRTLRREKCQFFIKSFYALPFFVFLASISQLFAYHIPKVAYHMLCIKRNKNK
jgi:ubiquinone/menaquinone biosynthesis C-methylase UbiE